MKNWSPAKPNTLISQCEHKLCVALYKGLRKTVQHLNIIHTELMTDLDEPDLQTLTLVVTCLKSAKFMTGGESRMRSSTKGGGEVECSFFEPPHEYRIIRFLRLA